MSLILDALNKADREQNSAEKVPDLKTVHAAVYSEPAETKQWFLWLALAAGFLLLLVVLLVLLLRPAAVPVPPVKAAPEPSVVQSVRASLAPVEEQPAPNPEASLPESAPLVAEARPAVSEEVQALYQAQTQLQPVVIQEPAVIKPAPSVAASAQYIRDEALAKRLWAESHRELPTRGIEPTREKPPEPVVETKVDARMEDTLAAYVDTPFLHELPTSVQNTIPTMMYALHQFEDGTVMINKKSYREGDQLPGGVLIERILADGLVLQLNGTQFKLSSLSSWVNY